MGGRGQAWSMDLVIGVLIFMLAIGIIYALLVSKGKEDTAPLRIESEVIATKLTTLDPANPDLVVATNNQLDEEDLYLLANRTVGRLGSSAQYNYNETQRRFGVKHEFCIYLQDENGNIVYIRNPLNASERFVGIGSGSVELNLTDKNVPCGCPVDCYPADMPQCDVGGIPQCS